MLCTLFFLKFPFPLTGQLRSRWKLLRCCRLGSPIRSAHSAVLPRLLSDSCADWLAPAHLGFVPHRNHARFFVVVLRALSFCTMNINCGCFAPPSRSPQKILEDAALSALALLMTYFASSKPASPPWPPPNPPSRALRMA